MIENVIVFSAGVIGAVVGGFFTVYATNKVIREEAQKESRQEEKEVRSVLAALRAEMHALWDFHMQRIGAAIEALGDGQALEFYYPLTQDYFTVYHSNASMIGRVDRDDLRSAIVVCYNKCKKVVDGFKYNNELFRQHRDLVNLVDDSPEVTQRTNAKYKELQEFGKVIREDHFLCKGYVERMIALLDKEAVKPL